VHDETREVALVHFGLDDFERRLLCLARRCLAVMGVCARDSARASTHATTNSARKYFDHKETIMSLKLYFSPGACSFVPHVLLQTTEVAFEPVMVKLHKGEQNGEEYKAINPRGQVPVLVDGDQVITQIVAIILYLDQKFPDAKFLPTEPVARAKAIEVLAWMNNTVHPTFTHIFMPQKFSDQTDVQVALKTFNTQIYRGLMAELESLVVKHLSPAGWLSGERLGPLDAYALTLTRWGSIAGINPADYPSLWAHVNQVANQSHVVQVIERERLQLNLYKAA
jgi:glutathione S-transferase